MAEDPKAQIVVYEGTDKTVTEYEGRDYIARRKTDLATREFPENLRDEQGERIEINGAGPEGTTVPGLHRFPTTGQRLGRKRQRRCKGSAQVVPEFYESRVHIDTILIRFHLLISPQNIENHPVLREWFDRNPEYALKKHISPGQETFIHFNLLSPSAFTAFDEERIQQWLKVQPFNFNDFVAAAFLPHVEPWFAAYRVYEVRKRRRKGCRCSDGTLARPASVYEL